MTSDCHPLPPCHQLPPATRIQLREYMHTTNQSLRAAVETKELLGKLSPAMQGELSLIVNEATLGCVWYLCLPGIEVGLLLELASQLRTSIFSPMEICPTGFLFIIHTGRVLYIFRPRGRGSILGEDILLNNPNLELSTPAIALAYTTTEYFDRSTLATTIASFPASLVRLSGVLLAPNLPCTSAAVCIPSMTRTSQRKCVTKRWQNWP
jgi:hypothetical protein